MENYVSCDKRSMFQSACDDEKLRQHVRYLELLSSELAEENELMRSAIVTSTMSICLLLVMLVVTWMRCCW